MTRWNGKTAGRQAPRIRWPLFWSAAAHLLVVSSLLALGAGIPASPFRAVVDVFLVGGTAGDRAVAKRTVPHPSAGELRARAVPHRAPGNLLAASSSSSRPRGTIEGENGRSLEEDTAHSAVVPGTPVGSVKEMTAREGPYPNDFLTAFGGPPSTVSPVDSSASATAALDSGRTGGGFGAGPGTALLRERIQSRIVYPEEAVRRGQQGEVLLRIHIGTGGVPREIRIARSSGARLLDEAARRGVVRAAPLPEGPGWVEVPVRFRLR